MHPSLPKSLTPELLANWLTQNAKEKFREEKKYYYTEDELHEFKDSAVRAGIELNNLATLKSKVNKLLDNGCSEYIQVDVLQTKGIKLLKDDRENNEKEVEKGYRVDVIEIYGIPNQDTSNMDFFDIEGNEVTERCRPLSAKETRDYFGMFAEFKHEKQA